MEWEFGLDKVSWTLEERDKYHKVHSLAVNLLPGRRAGKLYSAFTSFTCRAAGYKY